MSEMNLPEGWVETPLGEYLYLKNGYAFKSNSYVAKSDDTVPVIRISDIDGKIAHDEAAIHVKKADVVDGFEIKNGDLLIAMSGATTGKVGVYKGSEPAYQNQRVGNLKLHSNEHGSPKYKNHLIASLTPDILKIAYGGAQPNISGKAIEDLLVALPPLAEQQQIAQKLDELLAQVDTLKTRLDAIPNILKRFRQSVLAAAVSGRLTEGWRRSAKVLEPASELKIRWLVERRNNFELAQLDKVSRGIIKNPKKFIPPLDPDLETSQVSFPEIWEIVSVSEFAECLDSQRVPVKKDQRESAIGLYPYFGANGEVDRVDEFIFDDDLVMVTEDETFYGRIKPIAYRYTGKCWVNNHAHVLKAPNKIANDFLCYTLMYYKVIPWLTGTTGRAKLGQGSLNILPMGMPPEVEQIEIVRRVGQLFAYAEQIEQRVKDAQARVNHLTQSILAKAFRGELTADWRAQNPELISGENSAAALLERIRVEREVVSNKRKIKK